MEIPDKLMKKWTALRSPGDAEKMVERLPGSYTEIFYRALRTGECRDEVFKILAEFYEEKANLIKQYL